MLLTSYSSPSFNVRSMWLNQREFALSSKYSGKHSLMLPHTKWVKQKSVELLKVIFSIVKLEKILLVRYIKVWVQFNCNEHIAGKLSQGV